MKSFVCTFLMLIFAASVQAGLVGVTNPSFEDDVLDAGARSLAISGWYNRSAYCWATEETYKEGDYPSTEAGNNWAEFGRQSWIYQQIGTFEENLELQISMVTGSVIGQDYTGFQVSLWAGGDPALAGEENTFPDTTLSTLVGATQIAISDVILPESLLGAETGNFGNLGNATAADVAVTLSTGTGYSDTDALWLQIQAVDRKRALVDDIAVTVVPEPTTLALLAAGALTIIRRKK